MSRNKGYYTAGEKIFERQKYIICFYHSEIKFISLSRRVMFFFYYYIDKNYRSESKAHTFNRYKALAARRLEFLKYLPFDILFKKIILSHVKFPSSCLHFPAPLRTILCQLQ